MEQIDALLADAVAAGDVPCVIAMAVNDHGLVYQGAFGARTTGGDPIALDSVLRIASMTKPIVSVAALQLVEAGKLDLDDEGGAYLRELRDIQVLTGFDDAGVPQLRPPSRPITIRQLLTHTSGMGYPFIQQEMQRYQAFAGLPNLGEGKVASINYPLVCDPGERWEYSLSTDWVGRIVERVSDRELGDYLRHGILEPLGMDDTGFVFRPDHEERLVELRIRQRDGSFVAGPHDVPQAPEFYSGGGALYSTGPDYIRFLRMLLGNGRFDGAQILKPETVRELGTNQIGAFNAGAFRSAVQTRSLDVDFFPGTKKGWGLISMITEEPVFTGRVAGGMSWAGIMNTYFWVDPVRRVAGVFLTQVLPFVDPGALSVSMRFETEIYEALAA